MAKKTKPVIRTAATAHLDTVWNWDFETTITKHIRNTLEMNFRLFEKFPEYVFSFEGARRYELMEEYYPELFEKLKQYIAENRWFVTGSAYENGDVNAPSPEALIRNILIGQRYFMEKFGKKSADIYLPDCFGFGWALPSVMKHAGLLGFTTQKLSWGSAYGIPFDLGIWKGVDGSEVFASCNAGDYTRKLDKVRKLDFAANKLKENIEKYDLPTTHVLHGTGDIGGAPSDGSVETAVKEYKKNEKSDVDVTLEPIDKVFRDLNAMSDEAKAKLPVWNNELVAINHGVGGYTSRAIGKRWNKRGEQLADAAERTAFAAAWLGTAQYPAEVIDTAWKRIIAHQFHDDLPGTSLQRVYNRSWNDYMLSLNQLASVYEAAVLRIASRMTLPRVKGITLAVSNPTDAAVTEPVAFDAAKLPGAEFVKVKDASGSEVPSQLTDGKIVFSAHVPGNSVAVFTVQPAAKPYGKNTGLSVCADGMENVKYVLKLNDNGDIVSVFDKELGKEVLKAPVTMEIHDYFGSKDWPAWELDYPEVIAAPEGKAHNAEITVKENGPARAVIETRRTYGESVFIQRIILGEGSVWIRVENEIEWRGRGKLLKTPFCFTAENEEASYDLGLGVIRRGTDKPNLYEVPAQNWADISNKSFGVSVFSECKNGWDHPTPDTIRLTGIHTPLTDFSDESLQSLMDLGTNRYAFGIYSHKGANLAQTQRLAAAFVDPLAAFDVTGMKGGDLGGVYTYGMLSDGGVITRAFKKEYRGDRLIVRFNETENKAHKNVKFTLPCGIAKAVEVNAVEEEIGPAKVNRAGELVFDIEPYKPVAFALTLKHAADAFECAGTPVKIPFDTKASSVYQRRHAGIIGGYTLPAEQWPEKIDCGSVSFKTSQDKYNVLPTNRQEIKLPKGAKAAALLVTAVDGDKNVKLLCDGKETEIFVPDCFEAIGKWDMYGLLQTGRIKECRLAYEFTHVNSEYCSVPAKQCYLFCVAVPAAKEIVLPEDKGLLVFAVTALENAIPSGRLAPLYDQLETRPFTYTLPEELQKKAETCADF